MNYIGKYYLPEAKTSDFAYVEVIKLNKNGTYNVQPFYKNGKRGSAGAALLQDLERWERLGLHLEGFSLSNPSFKG